MIVSQNEVKAGQLTEANLALALRTLRDAGLVVLENVCDRALIAKVAAQYEVDLARHIESMGGLAKINASGNSGTNHVGMQVPMVQPYSDTQIIGHPIAVQIMDRALGTNYGCTAYHSNTAYPGSGYQQIHRDSGPVFGTQLGVATPATHLVLNIPLCDFTEENGSTEVWPGTHLIVDADPRDREELEERVKYLASIRTNVPAGSMILRDLRAWHRGVPNNSSAARAMLAIIYTRGGFAPAPNFDISQSIWDSWPERIQHIFRQNRIVANDAVPTSKIC